MMSVMRGPTWAAGVVAGIVAAVVLPAAAWMTGSAAATGRPEVIVGDSVLTSVFCTSRTDCWAVGDDEINNVVRNQALHFNGRKWSSVTTPQPGGTTLHDSSSLAGVRCTSRANCWAVGYYDKNGATLSQALHWNGKKWSQAATPAPGGKLNGDFNDLFDVVCTAASDCWAGGDFGGEIASNEVSLNLVLHWNGTRWSHVDTPNPAGTKPGDINGLNAIRCTSATNCWGAGAFGAAATDTSTFDNEILHWNGTKWSKVTVPNPGVSFNGQVDNHLNALSCTSAKSCWAVGADTGTAGFRNQSLHWNGRHWRTVRTPDPAVGTNANNGLSGVSCTTDTNCWAVGAGSTGGPGMNEALHWTGRKWLVATVPEPAGNASGSDNNLNADRCVSATNCWAVGDTQMFGEPEINQILHWTGRKWITAG